MFIVLIEKTVKRDTEPIHRPKSTRPIYSVPKPVIIPHVGLTS